MRRARKHKFLIWLEYIGLRVFYSSIRMMPLKLADACAAVLGRASFALLRSHRRRSIEHILYAGLAQSRREATSIARKSFIHLALTAIECVKFDQLTKRVDPASCLVKPREPEFDEIFDGDKGFIVASAHFGNWEVAGRLFAVLEKPIDTVVRPLDNPKINDMILSQRSESRQKTIEKKGALKSLLRALKMGRGVVLLVDQRANRTEGVLTTFFGRPALTHSAPARLHLKTGAPLVVGRLKRAAGAFRWEFSFRGPFTVERSGDKEKDIQALTQLYTSEIESIIREDPTQWLWAHRRWEEVRTSRSERRKHVRKPAADGSPPIFAEGIVQRETNT